MVGIYLYIYLPVYPGGMPPYVYPGGMPPYVPW